MRRRRRLEKRAESKRAGWHGQKSGAVVARRGKVMLDGCEIQDWHGETMHVDW